MLGEIIYVVVMIYTGVVFQAIVFDKHTPKFDRISFAILLILIVTIFFMIRNVIPIEQLNEFIKSWGR